MDLIATEKLLMDLQIVLQGIEIQLICVAHFWLVAYCDNSPGVASQTRARWEILHF